MTVVCPLYPAACGLKGRDCALSQSGIAVIIVFPFLFLLSAALVLSAWDGMGYLLKQYRCLFRPHVAGWKIMDNTPMAAVWIPAYQEFRSASTTRYGLALLRGKFATPSKGDGRMMECMLRDGYEMPLLEFPRTSVSGGDLEAGPGAAV